jgi:N,N'-diacetylchitobiose non-reducing end deacetylase
MGLSSILERVTILDVEKPAQPNTSLELFQEVKRAIVVCAHADDMETVIGGTIWLLAQRGVEIRELICTAGDIGSHDESHTRETLAAIRRAEAEAGARLLGVREVATLPYHDGELEPTLELRAEVARFYRRWQPDTLFTFDPSWAGQIHPDHRAAGRVAIDAIMPSKMRLYRPEQLSDGGVGKIERTFLFSPAEPALFVDISEVYDLKVAAALAHRSQFPEGSKSLDWMRELDSAAGKRAGLEGRYVEQLAALRLW